MAKWDKLGNIYRFTVIEKYMAQTLHIGLYRPFTKVPFGICAIYFDLKVKGFFNLSCTLMGRWDDPQKLCLDYDRTIILNFDDMLNAICGTLQGMITYPTLGKGKSSTQNAIFWGYVSFLEGKHSAIGKLR